MRVGKLLIENLAGNEALFGVELSAGVRERLAEHYELLLESNELLHLVAPCPAEEFATRHILESLTMLRHLPDGATFADVGTGGGFPAIPCLLARDDLRARLIESKEKKADFLSRAVERLGLAGRAEVIAKQFTETDAGPAKFVTCRAMDKFAERLPKLIKWAGPRSLLLFGGEQIATRLAECGVSASAELMPPSERRYLFVASRR